MHAKGIVCVWSLHEPSLPQHILICEGTPTCCCFGPGKDSLVFATTATGALLVWDLTEPPAMHVSHVVGGVEYLLRCPSFDTDGRDPPQSHESPVVALQPLGGGMRGGGDGDEQQIRASFQLLTLDEDAVLKTWTPIVLPRGDMAGSQRDLGLLPGARVKLELAATSVVTQAGAAGQGTMSAHCLAVFPNSPNRVLIGTNRGELVHWVRFGQRTSPRAFALSDVSHASEVMGACFSPFFPGYFIVGYTHGEVAFFKCTHSSPLARWSECFAGAAVLSLGFSPSRPGVFFALDAGSRLHIW